MGDFSYTASVEIFRIDTHKTHIQSSSEDDDDVDGIFGMVSVLRPAP